MHSRLSFPKSRRLRTGAEFQAVYRGNPRKIKGDKLAVLCKPNDLAFPRLGLSISKQKVRRAVDRFRIKRQAREVFRHHQHELTGVDIVVIAYPHPKPPTPAEIRTCLQQLWLQVLECYGRS